MLGTRPSARFDAARPCHVCNKRCQGQSHYDVVLCFTLPDGIAEEEQALEIRAEAREAGIIVETIRPVMEYPVTVPWSPYPVLGAWGTQFHWNEETPNA